MIDHTCLGRTDEIRDRRYSILSLLVKGTKPRDIVSLLGFTDDQVKNDIFFLTNTPLHNTTVDIAKDFNTSWYEIKVRELEGRLTDFKTDSKSWLTTQELIRKYKADSLKLMGLMNEKVEHSGDVTIKYVGDEIDGDTDKIPTPSTTEAVPLSKN